MSQHSHAHPEEYRNSSLRDYYKISAEELPHEEDEDDDEDEEDEEEDLEDFEVDLNNLDEEEA